tara:strand:+ start:1054 stop:1446 length:393 start_codon:yes stop_codon:yes gene_type:complete
MKTILALLMFTSPVMAGEYQRGYSHEKSCFRSEYREEYVPGTEQDPGYVRSWKETIEFPCDNKQSTIIRERRVVEEYREVDDNDCTDGKIAGGLIGGGVGAALSQGDGRWWAIPLGIVGGATVGCELNGG